MNPAIFDRFSLPDVARVARRTMLGAVVVGVISLVIALLFSQPWVALGLCVGLAFGIFNFRLIIRSVLKVGARSQENKRRPLALNTIGRLGLMTIVAFAVLLIKAPLGFGLVGGMALFQFILLGNVTGSMLKSGALTHLPALTDEDDETGNFGDGNSQRGAA